MRKVSKSRTDDEVISSTNGSIANDADETQPEVEPNASDDKNLDEDLNEDEPEKNGDDLDYTTDKPVKESKKKSGKSKSKKKKSSKKEKEVAEDDPEEEEEEEYEVEKIIDSKRIKGKLHYLIRWKGYSADTDTWEPENTLSCPDLINKFNEKDASKKKATVTPKSPVKRRGRPPKNAKPAKKPRTKPNSEWDSENADENAEYEVDRILEVHHKKNGSREFLIHWKGWSTKFDSWEPESNLNCKDLIKKFMDKVDSARKSDSKALRVNPGTTNRFTLQDPSSGRRLSKRRGQKQRVRYDDAE
ncbi:hypothetical protein JYU34_021149 [Plutella xylostella]|uniref:Chromo domain-containing protein n=1 Tax=Plutella xylostella TaxID=51655 RepID=A0ABQ7PSV4_PLUXY|nr:hypothetical protein JYU34_021149 [Plutella xylostella]